MQSRRTPTRTSPRSGFVYLLWPAQLHNTPKTTKAYFAVSVVTEILDRLPTPDGGMRRRFTAGLLFSLVTFVGIYWIPGIPALALIISDAASSTNLQWTHLNSTGVIIILFSIVFLIGSLVDIIAYVFLNRIFSTFGGTIAYRGIQTYIQGVFFGKEDSLFLHQAERATYEKLPEYVQRGLRDPYHRQFEVAFRYLIHVAPDDEKSWLQHLDSRNKNLFSVISSAFLAMLLLAILSLSADFISTPEHINPLSKSEKECYKNLVLTLRLQEIIDSEKASSMTVRIYGDDQYVVADIEVILQSDGYKDTMDEEYQNGAAHSALDPTMIHGKCKAIASDEHSALRVQSKFFFVSLVIFLLMLSSLAVIYALILRNSISSALDMLHLRRVLGHGPVEAGGESSLDKGMA